MKKNGFTLVEMLTVVVILVMLGLLSVFSINGILKKSSEELYELQVTNVIDAARTYAIQRSDELATNNQITICELKMVGLLENDFENPKTEEKFDDSLIIEIVKNANGEFNVTFDAIKKMESYYCDIEGIRVTLNGDSPIYVNLGANYRELGIKVQKKAENGSLTDYDPSYYEVAISGNYTSALSSGTYTRVGTFTQTYTVTDKANGFQTSITRTIVVEDNISPTITLSPSNELIYLLVGDVLNYPTCVAHDNLTANLTCKIEDNYQNATNPGTYEIVYTATDGSGNTATKAISIVVREKNKTLIGKVEISNFAWTSEDVTLEVEPLYNSSTCNNFLYSFDNGRNWSSVNQLVVSNNGTYKMGIKYDSNICTNLSDEEKNSKDIFNYNVTNIDKNAPTLAEASVKTETGNNKTTLTKEIVSEVVGDSVVEHKYYYTNLIYNNTADQLKIFDPTGATDDVSGISHYIIYVNDVEQENKEVTLSDAGRYVIKVQAVDFANNLSDLVEAAIIVVDKTAPTCVFASCINAIACNNNPAISGGNVTYQNGYQVTLDENNYQRVNFKLTCTDEFYAVDKDYTSSDSTNTNLKTSNFDFGNENGVEGTKSIVLSSSFINSSVSCVDDVTCARSYNFTVATNIGKAPSYNDNTIYLRLLANSFCDKAGNCNNTRISSMPLAKN